MVVDFRKASVAETVSGLSFFSCLFIIIGFGVFGVFIWRSYVWGGWSGRWGCRWLLL
ncbi:hypothetical protein BDQ12DRAFT_678408 [Crucibulum laeve]|uniref:Uncharacterized protein n=1 Tax=Crucibulum laeve TaxID=68775 RepID=A0A5C3M8S6_9AGAR|nr:hypothetical protein BDQ12DRAFT_678408 [Crucibulum laeve]